VQDADNLAWKLDLVVKGQASPDLLHSYHEERALAADDNLRNSTRSTDFISPKSRASLRLRNAVLELARTEAFARPLVNSGRLSTPTPYTTSPLNTADTEAFAGAMRPGAPCADAPVLVQGHSRWLLELLRGGFILLSFGAGAQAVRVGDVSAKVLEVGRDLVDSHGELTGRYDGQPGTVYLLRPDQHVAARWRRFDAAAVEAALRRALALH
jgi:3-(3-hydroxy-phenyl)propionate hydroxylase